ncbi:DUF1080 domain-containing protein, partial [bacterium]|nr:DUF1080 domain-containing protein [bacterium]
SKTTFKIAFSPDGKRLASVSFDGTAKIWVLEAPDAAAKLPGKPGVWVPLFDGETLDGWRVAKGGFFKKPGAVAVVGDRVLLEAGQPCTGIAVARSVPVEDYEFCVDAMRIDGRAGFCSILFPVGTSRCTLAVGGFGGGGVGLQTVDGRGGNNNPTTRQMQFQPGQWYQVRLRVTKDKIEAWVDDERMFSIERAGHKFGVFDGYESLRPLGVFSWTTTSALRNMRMRSLKPEAGPPAAPELPHRLKE